MARKTPLVPEACRRQKTADSVYECAVGAHGLYGKAFFGHRSTPAEKKKMERIWRASRKYAGELRGLRGADDSQLAFEAKDRIDKSRGALINAGNERRGCEKRLQSMSSALAGISAADALANMMTTGAKKKAIKRDIVRAARSGRTTFRRFQDACLR